MKNDSIILFVLQVTNNSQIKHAYSALQTISLASHQSSLQATESFHSINHWKSRHTSKINSTVSTQSISENHFLNEH